jgi:Flp pilus assembly protein TadD
VTLGVASLLLVWACWPKAAGPRPAPPNPAPPAADDPRFSSPTPYRNVRPGVRYVGDDACAACHAEVAKTYRGHPMARSLAPVAAATPIERFDESARNPFTTPGFRYQVERETNRALHKETLTDARGRPLAEAAAEVHFAVGSGHSGRSYILDRDGHLFNSPLTWYPAKGIWDLSPGYDKQNPHFDRPVTPDCLFCHANHVDHVADTVNHYRKPIFQGHGIGCERCHGPGELHVARHNQTDVPAGQDDTIVNPGKLEHALRESVCQQCHLQGQQRVWRRGRDTFDYRPGLPFQLFMSEFVKPAAEAGALKFVGTVEQMVASRCYQKSEGAGKMGCISCHDPHAVPAAEKKVSFYRQRCLNCHQEKGCSLPVAARREKDDSCIACHMPKTGSTVNHTAITDHSVPRAPERVRAKSDALVPAPAMPVPFHRAERDEREANRDLGIALVRLADSLPGDPARSFAQRGLILLKPALQKDRADLEARTAMGSALWFTGRLDDAFVAYREVLDQAPRRESTLFLAAKLALRLRRTDLARRWAEQLVEISPWRPGYHLTLAQAHGQSGEWQAASRAVGEAVKLNPADPGARQLLILCRLRLGEVAQAERELELLLATGPPQPEMLRAWFAQERSRAGGAPGRP